MAEVYLAHDDVLSRDVALKVMTERYAYDDEFVERFKREAQSAAALSHPNIVSIYDRGESKDGTYYIAMEYLPGGTLKDRLLKRGPLPPRTAAAVALQIAEALWVAHRAGVVHRDIKPHNVLITAAGNVKVGDFGIARAASSSTMTKTGSILGTAHYISPEQAMGEPVGPQSDLYSLGVVLYEMLTGELPYDAETPIGIAMKHVNGYLVPPRQLNPEVPEGIDAITVRLLAKNTDERYADAAELIEDLERVINGLEPAKTTTRLMSRLPAGSTARIRHSTAPIPPPVAKTSDDRDSSRRRRLPWVPVLLLLLLLTLLSGISYAFAQGLLSPTPQVEVPNLVGASSLEEAQKLAGEDFKITEGSRKDSKEPVGTVIAQDPKVGTETPKGSTISVDVSGTQIADLPDVRGQTREEAERILKEAGFEVEAKSADSSVQEKNLVTDQDPQGGESQTAKVGSTVTITVGSGPKTVQVPSLYNLTPAAAKQALEGASLSLGNQTEAANDQVPKGQIVDQQPAAGTEVSLGSSIDITVSSGPRQLPVPDVVGRSAEEAKQTIWDAGFGYVVQTAQSNQPAGTVLSTDPSGGTLLDPNSRSVTINQSSGPPPPSPPTQPASKTGNSKASPKGKSG